MLGLDGELSGLSQQLRDAQRKFYETLEQPPTGLVSKAKAATVPGAVETSPSERTPEARGGYAEASPRRRYGPERFFYDQRSYTGVHRNGPPNVVEKEAVRQIVRDTPSGTSPRTPASARSRAASFVSFRSRASSASSGRRHTLAEGEKSPRYGPERFFYDQQSYTGSHRMGGPTSSDGPKDLSEILRRETSPARAASQSGETRSRAASRASIASFCEEQSPRSARASRVSRASFASRASFTSRASFASLSEASPKTPQSARSSRVKLEDFRYGPERFFYDSRSYTGVHKHGGPTNVDVREETQVGRS